MGRQSDARAVAGKHGREAHAVQAARLDRRLRMQGCCVRSPIDVLLASFCMTQGPTLLRCDADVGGLIEGFKLVGEIDTWTS
jgi:predicted nucleic acid-binding protein